MDKDVVHIYNGILLNHKKEQQKIKQNKIVPFAATQMDLEIIILSKSEKDQYHMISLMWNLKYDTHELIEKQTHRHREQTGDCRAGRRLREGWSRRLVLADANYYIEGIKNKVPLYTTQNYIQYPMINHNKNEYKNIYIYN